MERQEGRLGPQATNQDTVLGHDRPAKDEEGRVNYRRNQVKVTALGRLSRAERPR